MSELDERDGDAVELVGDALGLSVLQPGRVLAMTHDDEDPVGVVLGDRIGDGLARRIGLDLDALGVSGSPICDRLTDGLRAVARLALVVREPLESRLLDGGRHNGELVVGSDVLRELASSDR